MLPREIVPVALAALLAAAAAAAPGSVEAAPLPNLLVVTLDTWRADALSSESATYRTPVLDGLAARGAHLRRVLTTAPITLPAHASLLSGLLPAHHGARDNGFYTVGAGVTTLAEMAHDRGYRTAAVVAATVLDRKFGLAQGYDAYDDEIGPDGESGLGTHFPERAAELVADRAIAALGTLPADAPWHLWVHFFDAHHPYVAHEGLPGGYAGEVAYMDAHLGRLLDALSRRADGARTLVLVTGDHGEGLGENGESTHGYFLYEPTVRVAALLAGPGVAAKRRVDEWVSSVDLLPTVVALLGWPAPRCDGRDLSPALRAGAPPPTAVPLFTETFMPWNSFRYAPSRAVVQEPRKAIVSGRLVELMSSSGDAAQTLPPRERAALVALIDGYAREDESAAGSAAPEGGTQAALESLGYLGAPAAGERMDGPPAKERLETIRSVHVAQELLAAGRAGEAEKMLTEVAACEPDNVRVRILRAGIAIDRLDHAAAVELLAPMKDGGGYYAALYHEAAANVALSRGKQDVALAELQASLKADEARLSVHASLALLHMARGEVAAALPHFERSRELAPADALVVFNLGLALVRAGEQERAITALKEAMALGADVPARILKTAEVDRSSGDLAGAGTLLEGYLAARPDDAEALVSLAKVLEARGEAKRAVELLEARARTAPAAARSRLLTLAGEISRRAGAARP